MTGKKGMLEIKSKGGYTIAESEETAVVFGMPAEVISAEQRTACFRFLKYRWS